MTLKPCCGSQAEMESTSLQVIAVKWISDPGFNFATYVWKFRRYTNILNFTDAEQISLIVCVMYDSILWFVRFV